MNDLGSTPLFYSARPTLEIEGEAQQSLEGGLLSLVVEEDTHGMARCEGTFGNWGARRGAVDFIYFDRDVLEFGKRLTVAAGVGDGAFQIFEGRISALEGRYPKSRPPEILVMAEDRLQDLRKTRRTRVFEDSTLADLARAMASDHGLTPEIDIDGPTYPVLTQLNQSDLAFLYAIADDVDGIVSVKGDTLSVQRRSQTSPETMTLTYGQGLHEFRVTADLADQCSALIVGGWDVTGKSAVESEAGPSSLGAENEGTHGSEVLEAALGARTERIVHRMPLSQAEGDGLAKAEFRRRARRFVTGEGIAEGDGRLRAGATITLRGLGPLFDGAYVLTWVRHVFSMERGYQTEFAVERPWIGN